jgi:hypothetical protein
MSDSKPVEIPSRARAPEDGGGDPVEAPAWSQMGSTFKERAAAAKKAQKKAVSSDAAENKAVGSAETKRRK